MKLAWFTPFDRSSAIGEFSRLVTDTLSEYADVELWTPQTTDPIPTELPIVRFNHHRLDRERLAEVDVIFYNAGNNFAFHEAVMSVAHFVPGVVILHDSVLHHYYLDEARFGTGSLDRYLDALTRWYGADVASAARGHLGNAPFVGYPPDQFTADYPLIEEATLGALGVIVHANSQRVQVLPHWVGPIGRLDLPIRGAERAITDPDPEALPRDRPLRLVSFGTVGSPKQIHLVLEALGRRQDLRRRIQYIVAGAYDPRSEYFGALRELIARYDLDDVVQFRGHVSDDELSQITDWADAFMNLRWPSTEGGSASLTQQLLTGRPVVVSRSGIFDEVPENAAIKLESQDVDGVTRAIEILLAGPDERRRVGIRGRRYARRFSADAYSRRILEMATEAYRWVPVAATLDRVGDHLRDIGATPGLPVLTTVGAELSQIFGVEFAQGRGPATQESRNGG